MSGHLLVTGGAGFAMAHVVRAWAASDPSARVTVLDPSPFDGAAQRFLAPVIDRVRLIRGSAADPAAWAACPADVDALVHGAAVTPHSWTDVAGRLRSLEREDPAAILESNVTGAARAFDWAARLSRPPRVVNVSSGSVYALAVPPSEPDAELIPEDRHVAPERLYDISKLSAEQIGRRLAAVHGLTLVSVRLSAVFGPLDRPTPARRVDSMIKRVVEAAVAGRPVACVSPATVGDFVAAGCVARGILAILGAAPARLRHDVYNLADGKLTSLEALAAALAPLTGPVRLETAPPERAEITQPPDQRTGRFAAYDIARARADLGWSPRPLAETLADYVAWLRHGG